MRWLIIFGTNRDQSAKIAQCIARGLLGFGDEVDLYNAASPPTALKIIGYDAVVVSASVHAGQLQRAVRQFVGEHLAELRRVPSAFFSVSLLEAQPDPTQHDHAQSTTDALLEETGWQPDAIADFAGAIPRRHEGNWFRQRVVRRDQRRDGTASEVAGYAYADWDAVAHFVRECAMHACSARPADLAGSAQATPR